MIDFYTFNNENVCIDYFNFNIVLLNNWIFIKLIKIKLNIEKQLFIIFFMNLRNFKNILQ